MNVITEICAHCEKPIMEYGSEGSNAYVHIDSDARTCDPKGFPNPEWSGVYTYAEPAR